MADEASTAGRPGPYLPRIPHTSTRTIQHSTLASRAAAGPYSLSAVRLVKASQSSSPEKPKQKS